MHLLGAMTVARVVSRAAAARHFKLPVGQIWDARFHLLAVPGSGTAIQWRDVTSAVPEIRFASRTATIQMENGRVPGQALRTMRPLTQPTVELFDRLLGAMSAASVAHSEPDELLTLEVLKQEGRLAVRQHVSAERSRSNRDKVLARQLEPYQCELCGYSFAANFGPEFATCIEVHHLKPVGSSGQRIPTTAEFAILCANCHTAAHWRSATRPLTLAELRSRRRRMGAEILPPLRVKDRRRA